MSEFLISNYNTQLVTLSFLVAVFASYVALDLARRVEDAVGNPARIWLICGSLVMGSGIWSMHFIAMMAFSLPIPLGYDWFITLLSWLAAVSVSGIALLIASRKELHRRQLVLGSLTMGVGISLMHYVGMLAMRMNPSIQWDPWLFLLSIVIAIVASFAALRIFFWMRSHPPQQVFAWQILASLVMGAAIFSMHYTGMAAAQFPVGSICRAAYGFGTNWLGYAVGAVAFGLLTVVLVTSLIDTRLQARMLEGEESAKLVLENSIDAIINMDSAGLVIEWSGAAARMFGYPRDEAMGKILAELIIPAKDRAAHKQGMQRLLATNQAHIVGKRIEVIALRRDGSEFPVELSIAQIRRGELIFFSAFIRDITERKQSESRIQHLVHFDALTGLPNRSVLQDHLKYALSLAKRNNGKLAVMFLDLDHFKYINDTLGHSVGDVLLIEVANRLRLMLREEDTLSRLGGDEFILILPGTDVRGAAKVSQKLLSVIAEPYCLEPYELTVTCSIGIALYPDDGTDLETLSRNADTAMYRAKQEGRNGYRYFTAEMQASSSRNLQLVTALRYALDRKQLYLHYQPQLSMYDDRIIGAEALLRWQHPELGSISPAEFIPIAEDTGLILPIGEWVLRQAVQQAKVWIEDGHGPLIMAVNLSAIQFRHSDLPDLVMRILNEVGLPPEYLELELTEGVAMHDPQGAIAVMNNLHELGIRMSIDDFGTGYSSLSYLKKFKVYKLKIDQSFVRDISTDPEDKAIVSAIINMARSLGLQTIAEGVETSEQLAFLREQGCDEVQGYYYSKPLPAEQFDQFLKENSNKIGKLLRSRSF